MGVHYGDEIPVNSTTFLSLVVRCKFNSTPIKPRICHSFHAMLSNFKYLSAAWIVHSIKYESAMDLMSFEKVTASFISRSVTSVT